MSPYRSQSPDTPEEIDRRVFEHFRRMTPVESIERVWELNEWASSRARIGFKQQYPAASEREIELRLAALKYGRELIWRAYGWDPDAPSDEHGPPRL